ncbi:hypothetical protein THAOC_29285 [Thalassiosira oceanica]|uniref:Uncharacterized protein n=1 Tax=Thalassiosira oceanica TaxID=159749 RepID=K0RE96_THAOC|nr:hypothetical protein THAOC_29285 [Thalassiosira oceanica]|eukprot:EJK51540.1 hypothetical protein THAOC_29285 [Thalassiosira oceanica]
MIASAMSRRSLRAAGGLRRPSESRVFLASRSTIYLDDSCSPNRRRWLSDGLSTEEPKACATVYGIVEMVDPPIFAPSSLPDAAVYGGIGGIGHNLHNPGIPALCPAPA